MCFHLLFDPQAAEKHKEPAEEALVPSRGTIQALTVFLQPRIRDGQVQIHLILKVNIDGGTSDNLVTTGVILRDDSSLVWACSSTIQPASNLEDQALEAEALAHLQGLQIAHDLHFRKPKVILEGDCKFMADVLQGKIRAYPWRRINTIVKH